MIGTIGGCSLTLRGIPRTRLSSQPRPEDVLIDCLVMCPYSAFCKDHEPSPQARMTPPDEHAFPHASAAFLERFAFACRPVGHPRSSSPCGGGLRWGVTCGVPPHPNLPPRGGKVTHKIAKRSSAIDMPGPLLTDVSWEDRPPAALKARFHITSVAGSIRPGRPAKTSLVLSE